MPLSFNNEYFLMTRDQTVYADSKEEYKKHQDKIIDEIEDFRLEVQQFLETKSFKGIDGRLERLAEAGDEHSADYDYILGHVLVGFGSSKLHVLAKSDVIEALEKHFGERLFASKPALHSHAPKPPQP